MSKLTGIACAYISGEAVSGEVKGEYDTEVNGCSSATEHAIAHEELDWLFLGIIGVEDFLEEVLEGEFLA